MLQITCLVPGMRTGGKQGEDRDEVLETFNVDDSDKLQEIANLLKEQSTMIKMFSSRNMKHDGLRRDSSFTLLC